jgi:hypothetical protein
MHAADAAGGEDSDAGTVRQVHSGSHGRRACLFPYDGGSQVTTAELDGGRIASGQLFDGLIIQADGWLAPQDCDSGRHDILAADGFLGVPGRLQVVRPGQALGNERRLKRHYGPALVQCRLNFRMNVKPGWDCFHDLR